MRRFPPALADRRAFFRDVLRYAALGGLAVLGVVLARRGGPFAASGCIAAGRCGGCPRQSGCQLPPARAAATRRSTLPT